MGRCSESGRIIKVIGKVGSLKATGPENSRIDVYNSQGKLVQQRWYNAKGKAILNKDYEHRDNRHDHVFPHYHRWDWTQAQPRCRGVVDLDVDGYLGEDFR